MRDDEAIPKSNPKLKALNSKQILISKFKTQTPFGYLDFGHLILFSISNLEFCSSRIATPSARNDREGWLAMTPFRHCEEIRQLTDDEAIWYPAGIATPEPALSGEILRYAQNDSK